MADLLLLQQQARLAGTAEELGHLLVNDTATLVPYRTAVFWLKRNRSDGRGQIAAVSGLPEPSDDAPFIGWSRRAMTYFAETRALDAPAEVTLSDLPEALAPDWSDYLAAHGLWVPLTVHGVSIGGLLLARDHAFRESECRLLNQWAGAAAHALDALRSRGRKRIGGLLQSRRRRLLAGLALLAVTALLFIPVRLSVLAPAEVIGNQAAIVRAPLDGVIATVLIKANEAVTRNQPLLKLDDTEIASRLEVARQALDVAIAEHRQATQAALADADARALVGVLARRIEQKRAELAYIQSLRDRLTVRAPRGGIAVLPDAEALIGRPVELGARIFEIADPNDPSLEVWLPVGDGLVLEPGADISFFLNIAPEAPIDAELVKTAYRASQSPSGSLAFRLEGRFLKGGGQPRIGLRGVAKIHGQQVSLAYYLSRRPLAALRQWLGL